MKDSRDTAISTLVILAMPVILSLLVIVTLPLALFNAWAAQKMYDWFLLPIHGFPHLNLWHVYGITLLIGLFSATQTNSKKSFSDSMAAIVGKIIATLLVLLIGYIIKGHIGY